MNVYMLLSLLLLTVRNVQSKKIHFSTFSCTTYITRSRYTLCTPLQHNFNVCITGRCVSADTVNVCHESMINLLIGTDYRYIYGNTFAYRGFAHIIRFNFRRMATATCNLSSEICFYITSISK